MAAVMADPSRKDVVIAILGASAALGGFVLVFLGLLISTYRAYTADTPKQVKDNWRRAVWPVLAVFGASIMVIALALTWLVAPGGSCFYRALVGAFAAELAAIVAVAVWTVRGVLE